VIDEPFQQWISTRYTPQNGQSVANWPSLALSTPSQIEIASLDSSVFMLTNEALICCAKSSDLTSNGCTTISVPGGELAKMVVSSRTDASTISLAISQINGLSVVSCGIGCTRCAVIAHSTGPQGFGKAVHAMLWADDIWVAADNGLFAYKMTTSATAVSLVHIAEIDPCFHNSSNASVYALAHMNGLLVASTDRCISFMNTSVVSKIKRVRREWNGGLFDGTVRCLGFSAASQTLWAVTNSSVNSYTMPKDIPPESCGESAGVAGLWERFPAGLGGLPYTSCLGGIAMVQAATASHTAASNAADGDVLWIGTQHGLVRCKSTKSFDVFSGPRWLPTTEGVAAVTSVVSMHEGIFHGAHPCTHLIANHRYSPAGCLY
jgi:ligand-binding sensor domain-containing protein